MAINSIIDHTLLKPEATSIMVENLCKEAIEFGFAAVCVNPYYVKKAKSLLKDSNVKVATVVGFPLGANTKEVKAFEAKKAVEDGADEIDMVINIGALKNKDYEYVKEDIRAVVDAVEGKAIVKVIIETCLLSKEEKINACKLSKEAGADFVKTSTGFSTGGATVEDVKLMKETVGDSMKIKASGGIRNFETAKAMIEAGASRIGASSSIKIVAGENEV
ncbi:MAG: deoxyribose-phosphate aldolase [Tissierellia bacterium]|nr:deoxyribose-phosphate aldolase [Tissierellia bacterium]